VQRAVEVGHRQVHGPQREIGGQRGTGAREGGIQLLGVLRRGGRFDGRKLVAHCS
jgi:hypothetical protein